jgi:hypothetical protein
MIIVSLRPMDDWSRESMPRIKMLVRPGAVRYTNVVIMAIINIGMLKQKKQLQQPRFFRL